jgi:hypothetical protein
LQYRAENAAGTIEITVNMYKVAYLESGIVFIIQP